MDPLSAVTGISGICATGVKLMVALYKYVEDVRDVPDYIESLISELSAVSASLQSLKELVTRRGESRKEFVRLWAKDFKIVLEKCDKTFCRIDVMIKESKIKTKSSVKGQVIKCVRWEWHKDKVEDERDRLGRYRASIELMLKTLDSQQLDNINDLVEKIHQSVIDMQENRKFVKEVLEVMENGHPRFESADYTLTHNPAPLPPPTQSEASSQAYSSTSTQPLPHAGSNVSTSTQTETPTPDTKLLDALQSTTWTPERIRCGNLSVDMPPWPITLVKPSLRIVTRWGKIASLEICKPVEVLLETPSAPDRNPGENASDEEKQQYSRYRIHDVLQYYPAFNEEAPTDRVVYELTFSKIVRQSPTVIRICHRLDEYNRRWQDELEIQFKQESKAEEFLVALQKARGELARYWKALWLNSMDLKDVKVRKQNQWAIDDVVARTEEVWAYLTNLKAGELQWDVL